MKTSNINFLKSLSMKLAILLIFLGSLTACEVQNQSEYDELSTEEINQILSDVVGSEEALIEGAMNYFNGLSSENRNMITPEDLLSLIDSQNEGYTIIDLRSAEDFAKGHIKGAKNIFWYEVGNHLSELPKDQRIFLTCYSGQSAGQVVGVLKVLGYDVVSLAGGMNNGWLAKELPTTIE